MFACALCQVTALCSAGGQQNLILLDRTVHKPVSAGSVGWAGSTFGPLHKSRTGEHEFEALMRTLDNLGYRTGYAYRFPVLLERSRTRRDVEVPATVTAFHQFDDDGVHPALRQHPFVQRQQQERTRWLNTPNTYQKVSQEQVNLGHQRSTWLKAEEVTQAGSTAIKMENPNQFVPLFTNPQEVIETRNKIRQQNRQDMKTAGPQSQVLASVITDDSPSAPVTPPKDPPEPEPPNPFNQLTDQELEEYRKEVERKRDGGTNEVETKTDSPTMQNGGEEEKQLTEELEKGMKALTTNDTSTPAAPPTKPQGGTPEGSPCKSPSKKKKKFKPPMFLKKSKKQKEKAET
uniref:Adducin 2 (beta) n=1 Tax=Oryzias sinensis TaxID=183150 RepID=A0A8C8A1B7_9TELE